MKKFQYIITVEAPTAWGGTRDENALAAYIGGHIDQAAKESLRTFPSLSVSTADFSKAFSLSPE